LAELTCSYIKDVEDMAEWLVKQLTALGATVEKRPIGSHTLEGKEVKLPPVVIGQVGTDPKKVSFSQHTSFMVLPRPCDLYLSGQT
jgi:Cys-Gly metallodipeptidase DUG1